VFSPDGKRYKRSTPSSTADWKSVQAELSLE
jgi:hypothetical protein